MLHIIKVWVPHILISSSSQSEDPIDILFPVPIFFLGSEDIDYYFTINLRKC
jgi:hypothetical protein